MAEDSFKNLLFAFILFSLFGFLILFAVYDEGEIYGKNTTLIEGTFNLGDFNDSISSIEDTSENLRENFEKQSIWSSVAGVVVTGIFGLAKSMVLMIMLPFSLLSGIMVNVLHIPIIVSSVILGLLILSIIFGIWSLIKIGN